MDLSTLRPESGTRKKGKRVGRGPSSGNGKTSGRGMNGQKSRSGYSRRAGFEGGQMPLHRRIPKRGFYHYKRFDFAVVNLDVLDEAFESGAVITPELLLERDLVAPGKGGVKVLGRGETSKALVLKVNAITPSARAKIEAAGGKVEVIELPAAAQGEDN